MFPHGALLAIRRYILPTIHISREQQKWNVTYIFVSSEQILLTLTTTDKKWSWELCEKRGEKGETGERSSESTIQQKKSHVIVDPVITRHNDVSSSTCGADKKERKSENGKLKTEKKWYGREGARFESWLRERGWCGMCGAMRYTRKRLEAD